MRIPGEYSDPEMYLFNDPVQKGDDRLVVRFFMKAKQNQKKSDEAGHPVFEDREYLSIRRLGDNLVEHVTPARDLHKRRFSRQYEAFRIGQDGAKVGTPLKEWPPVTRSEVEELAFRRIHTVEQLASSEPTETGVERGALLVIRAKDFLAAAKEGARDSKLRAEIESRDAKLLEMQAQMDAQREAMERLTAQLTGGAVPKLPGRPPGKRGKSPAASEEA